jgi:hypothetical protein
METEITVDFLTPLLLNDSSLALSMPPGGVARIHWGLRSTVLYLSGQSSSEIAAHPGLLSNAFFAYE